MSDAITHPFPEPPAEGDAITVAPGILWMRLPLPMALDHVNFYAIDEGDSWTLIDTGMQTPRAETLWQTLLAGPLQGRPVRRVIGTHHHPDHIGMAGWFQERGAELWMTRTAWLTARMLTLDVQERPSEASLLYWRRAGESAEALARRARLRPTNMADLVHPMPARYRRLREGDSLAMGGRDWLVRVDHGHAPAHLTLWSGDLVLGGDQLLPGISANLGVHASEPEADPVEEWLSSCRRLLPHADAGQLILPGHKLPFRGLPFRLGQMIENHVAGLDRLREHLRSPRRALDCFPVLFKRKIGPMELGLATAETCAHLNHLWLRGEITRELDADGAWIWQLAPVA